jgi:DNA polymerase (family 10)
MFEKNRQAAHMFRQIAALLDEQGVAFKPNAYRKAAQVVEDLEKDIADYKDEKELKALPGIGEATAGKLREFVTTGKMKALDELMAAQGGLSSDLMNIEDLGPKRVRQLQKELGIQNVADLIKAAEEGKLRTLPRLSETMEKKILENARNVTERSKRFPYDEVKPDAETLLETVCAVPGVERAEIAGSFRRHKSTIGDLDILVVADDAKAVSDAISKLPIVRNVVAHGETKLSFNLQSLLRVDVRFVDGSEWGSALLYFTGDKEHNISLRKRAIDRGWKLNEYALKDGDTIIAGTEEKDIYEALGLPFIEPSKRTGALPEAGKSVI